MDTDRWDHLGLFYAAAIAAALIVLWRFLI
jgi:hypothetical protein